MRTVRRAVPPWLVAASLGGGVCSSAASPGAWVPEAFGPLDRPPALRPVGEPATVVTREAFLTRRRRAPHADLAAAWARIDAGRLAEADEALERLRWAHPGDGRVTLAAAVSRLLGSAPHGSLPIWERLLAEEPEAIAYVSLGREARLRVADARTRVHTRLPLDPKPARSLSLMAVCDTLLGDFSFAEQRIAEARARVGQGAGLLALATVVERLSAGSLADWPGTAPRRAWAARPASIVEPGVHPTRPGTPSPGPLAAVAARPEAGAASSPPRAAAEEPTPRRPRDPLAPEAVAPDLAGLTRRLGEAAEAVRRFDVLLHERLAPLTALPADDGVPEPEPPERSAPASPNAGTRDRAAR